jgi:hypothetical protein
MPLTRPRYCTLSRGKDVPPALLDFVETSDAKYVELCQMISYIASYLTDDEREWFLS